MALTNEQQAMELISGAKQILVLCSEQPIIDAISSITAIGLMLKKLNKNFDAVIPGWTAESLPAFLANTDIRPAMGPVRTFKLQVNVQNVPLSELMYDVKDGKLDITLVPKHGEWSPSDLTFRAGEDRYDLIIAIGSPDMSSLGSIAVRQAEFLYRTPIVNIDHHSTNEHWGELNLVDLNAVSTTQVIYNWLKEWNKAFIDSAIATALLAGMISETRSFRTARVRPSPLLSASELVEMGAEREKIIHGLWRTRSVQTLRLWGRALSRLDQDPEVGLVWTALSQSDFVESGASVSCIEGIVDELLAYAPEAKAVAIVSQTNADQLRVDVFTTPPLSAVALARPFDGHGTQDRATFTMTTNDIVVTAQEVIEKLKKILKGIK